MRLPLASVVGWPAGGQSAGEEEVKPAAKSPSPCTRRPLPTTSRAPGESKMARRERRVVSMGRGSPSARPRAAAARAKLATQERAATPPPPPPPQRKRRKRSRRRRRRRRRRGPPPPPCPPLRTTSPPRSKEIGGTSVQCSSAKRPDPKPRRRVTKTPPSWRRAKTWSCFSGRIRNWPPRRRGRTLSARPRGAACSSRLTTSSSRASSTSTSRSSSSSSTTTKAAWGLFSTAPRSTTWDTSAETPLDRLRTTSSTLAATSEMARCRSCTARSR
mmetsp:Transcript_15709/g.25306  ORF Transcript_15709/g.25306 Transcript_15709/m.25306 type:complete len:273 (+) Transcript_15709:175-993(+)